MIGEQFNRLTVVEFARRDASRSLYWLCHCTCGNDTVVRGSHLRTGHTKSCGCLDQETKTIHGHSIGGNGYGSPTYISYQAMIDRCTRQGNKDYHHYGGRGIKVCSQWQQNFTNFLYVSEILHARRQLLPTEYPRSAIRLSKC
jgi:hypothetical protein